MKQLITIEMDAPISGDMVGRMVKIGLHYGTIIVVDDDVEAEDVPVENRIKMIENRIKMLEQKASDLFTSIAKIDDIDIDRRLKILTGRLELTTRNAVANENELLKTVERLDDIERKQAEHEHPLTEDKIGLLLGTVSNLMGLINDIDERLAYH